MKRIFIMLIVAMFSFSVEAQNLSTEEESKAYTEVVKAFMKTDMTTFYDNKYNQANGEDL